jgi:D-threonate/D-erythronate kinase
MIAVIADDFTGAAELAGVGLRYQLAVELATAVNPHTKADLLVIATNSRSLTEAAAVQEMEQHTRHLLALQPELIFKKTDSVLRGHVLAEITAQLAITGCEKVLLVPANPVLGRTIENGHYFFQGKPIHESHFSYDPEFAITSSAIEHMLRSKQDEVITRKSNEALPATGVVVGEATTDTDLHHWAGRIDNNTLLAGASGFFNALLTAKYGEPKQYAETVSGWQADSPCLYVCGTTFGTSRDAIQQLQATGGPVCYMPADIIRSLHCGKYSYVKWANEVVARVNKEGKAIVAIHADSTNGTTATAQQLKEKMAGLVNEVLQRSRIQELVIEGGATAWEVIVRSGCTQFFPVQEMAPGVVRMQAGNTPLYVTVKPGSYTWPSGLWDF